MVAWKIHAMNVPDSWYFLRLKETWARVQLNRQEWPYWSLFLDLSFWFVRSLVRCWNIRYAICVHLYNNSQRCLFLCLTSLTLLIYIDAHLYNSVGIYIHIRVHKYTYFWVTWFSWDVNTMRACLFPNAHMYVSMYKIMLMYIINHNNNLNHL